MAREEFIGAGFASDPAKVSTERDRRIALGFTAATSSGKSIPVDTRHDVDFRNLSGLSSAAMARLMISSSEMFNFRDAENVDHELTPSEMMEVGMQVLGHVEAHYAAAWAIKELDPFPADYADDSRWP